VNGYVAAGESESVGRLRVRWAPIPQSGREEGSPVSTMLMIRFKRCVLKYHHRWGAEVKFSFGKINTVNIDEERK
jgi:hypothetical protein